MRNGPNAASLPSGGYLTTADHKPVIGIAQDGNLYIIDKNYRLTYSTNK